MYKRLITTGILIPMVMIILFLVPPIIFAIATLVVCMLTAWEWGQMLQLTSRDQCLWLIMIFSLLFTLILCTLPLCPTLIIVGQIKYVLLLTILWWLSALLLVLYYPYSAIFWRNYQLLKLMFGCCIIIPFFYSMLLLRQYHYNINHLTGSWWLLYVMLLVWSIDSGAYIFGCLFGYHKLAPKISPSKTWEGLFGGLITVAISTAVFVTYAPIYIAPFTLLIYSVGICFASVLGDLTESMFKREAGIKDSSNLLPGHGGILDRIDSLSAAVPIFTYLILLVFNHS